MRARARRRRDRARVARGAKVEPQSRAMRPAGRVTLATALAASLAAAACDARVQPARPPPAAREIPIEPVPSSSAPPPGEAAGAPAPKRRSVSSPRPSTAPYTLHYEPYETVLLNDLDEEGRAVRARADGHCYVLGPGHQPLIVDCSAHMMAPGWDACLHGLILEIEPRRTCVCEHEGAPVTKVSCVR